MRPLFFVLFLYICIGIVATPVFSQLQNLLLDDFEGAISGGPEGTVNFGAGGGSSVEVVAATDISYSGKQSLKITYKTVPPTYSYIYVNKGLDAGPNMRWLVEPQDIDWEEFDAIAFYMYGSDSKTRFAFDIIDNGSEVWRFIVEDNFIGWKQIVCPFSEFYVIGVWQPDNADKNANLDFPIRDFQIKPLHDGETKEGTVYFDRVELIASTTASAELQNLLLDDFEGAISGGPEGTVNFGAGGGSSVEVVAATDISYSGKQSLKITYKAVPPTYSYIYVGKGIDAGPNMRWLVEPQDIDWEEFDAIAFYMYGSDSKTRFAFDIIDNGSEVWSFIVEDNFIGWKQIVCPFSEFYVRGVWQPDNADKNANLDFPIRNFLIKLTSDGETKEGTVYFDRVELFSK